MRISIAIFALINNSSADVGVWDDTAFCTAANSVISTIPNSQFTLQDCADYCVIQYQGSSYNGDACCDFEGWTTGLSDCTLYDNNDGWSPTGPYTNMGAYGDTTNNFYASLIITANGTGDATADYPVDLPVPGTQCVNDDSTVDLSGDTCSSMYDSYKQDFCGQFDTYEFSSYIQCCGCGGGAGTVLAGQACINDDSSANSYGQTCTDFYDSVDVPYYFRTDTELTYSPSCEAFDTEDFSAAEQCCNCGGGADYSMGIVGGEVASLCENDDSIGDVHGDTCSGWYDYYPSGCGSYDTDQFTAMTACCKCGGGFQ